LAALFARNILVIFLEPEAAFLQYALLLRNVYFALPMYTSLCKSTAH
ncbi:5214_t:CDS:1, partial [Funneliformis geosporum]